MTARCRCRSPRARRSLRALRVKRRGAPGRDASEATEPSIQAERRAPRASPFHTGGRACTRESLRSPMSTLFLTCAALGGGILLVQLLLSAIGFDHDSTEHGSFADASASGLDLFSVRALAAGLAFFGIGGIAGMATGLG